MGSKGKATCFIREPDYDLASQISDLLDKDEVLESTFSRKRSFRNKMRRRRNN